MTFTEWTEFARKYVTTDKSDWIVRCIAYEEFQSRLEVYDNNGYAEEWNGGRELADISADQLEAILDDFVERFGNEVAWAMDGAMNNAILDVTGLYC